MSSAKTYHKNMFENIQELSENEKNASKNYGIDSNLSDALQVEKSCLDKNDGEKNKNETDKISEAQRKWNEVKNKIENTADLLGCEIDEGIKDIVIALNALEINTAQSCEGHVDGGRSAPWVRIEAPDEPEERFVGQNEIFKKVAKKYNMPVEETKKMFNIDAYREAFHECTLNDETEDYKKWREKSAELLGLVKEFLEDFYKNHQVPDNVKIKVDAESIDDMPEGSFEIFNGGEDQRIIKSPLSKEEKESLDKRLLEYRKEMKVFANFLKDNFFGERENYLENNKSSEKNI